MACILFKRLLLLLTRCIPEESGFDLVPCHFPHTSERRETPYNTRYRSVLNSHMSRREMPYNMGYRSVLKDWYWLKKIDERISQRKSWIFFHWWMRVIIHSSLDLYLFKIAWSVQDGISNSPEAIPFKFIATSAIIQINVIYNVAVPVLEEFTNFNLTLDCYDSFVLYAWLTSAFSSLLVFTSVSLFTTKRNTFNYILAKFLKSETFKIIYIM